MEDVMVDITIKLQILKKKNNKCFKTKWLILATSIYIFKFIFF